MEINEIVQRFERYNDDEKAKGCGNEDELAKLFLQDNTLLSDFEKHDLLHHISLCPYCLHKVAQNYKMDKEYQEKKIIPIRFKTKSKEIIENLVPKAAGESTSIMPEVKFPRSLFEENIGLNFKFNPSNYDLEVFLIGGDSTFRKSIIMKIHYNNGEQDLFSGESLKIGGVWRIDKEKATVIKSIEVKVGDKNGKTQN